MPALLACSVAACSSSTDGSSGSTPTTGLAKAMASVSGTGAATTLFEYGDLARMRELKLIDPAGVSDRNKQLLNPRWATVVGTGLGRLADTVAVLSPRIGVNPFAADTAVMIGQPPNTAVRLDGNVDDAAVQAKLTKLGAKPRTFGKTAGLSLGGDNKIDLSSPLAGYGIVNQLNQVVVTRNTFAASPNAATLRLVRGGGTSLLDTGRYADVAECLGDVIAADVLDTSQATSAETTTVVAAGVRAPTDPAAADTEVLCFVPVAGSEKTVQQAAKKNLTLTSTAGSGVRLSTLLDSIKIDTVGSVVRATVTVRADSAPGFVLKSLPLRDYRFWDGSCTVPSTTTRRTC